jgi:hypothetical protein
MKLSALLQLSLAASASCHRGPHSNNHHALRSTLSPRDDDPSGLCQTDDICQKVEGDPSRHCAAQYNNDDADLDDILDDIIFQLGVGFCYQPEGKCYCKVQDDPKHNYAFCREFFSKIGWPDLKVVAGCQFPDPDGGPTVNMQCRISCINGDGDSCSGLEGFTPRSDLGPQKFFSGWPDCPGPDLY